MARALAVVALVALLVGLCLWWTDQIVDGRVGHMAMLERPDDYDEEPVVLSLVTVLEVEEARYRVTEGTLAFDVTGPTAGRTVGEEITVIGRWDAHERLVIAEEVHPAPGRTGKKVLGVIGLAALGLLLPLWFVPVRGGLAVRG